MGSRPDDLLCSGVEESAEETPELWRLLRRERLRFLERLKVRETDLKTAVGDFGVLGTSSSGKVCIVS